MPWGKLVVFMFIGKRMLVQPNCDYSSSSASLLASLTSMCDTGATQFGVILVLARSSPMLPVTKWQAAFCWLGHSFIQLLVGTLALVSMGAATKVVQPA